jgi:enoyl-CoA hydratase/carnithine racemase
MHDSFETITYEEKDGVAWVTLNRPDVHNAFNRAMRRELHEVWTALRRHDVVRCVVLTGAGDRAFCTGIDRAETLDEPPPIGPDGREQIRGFGSTPFMYDDQGTGLGPKSAELWKPVIAAVNGMACAGAFYMLGEADFIIASENATFFDPHVTFGMPAAIEPLHMLPKVPFSELMRMSLLGNHERMSAARAYQIEMVSEVVPLEQLREKAAWAAEAIASAPPLAVQATVRAVWSGLESFHSQALNLAYSYLAMGTTNESLEEGQESFRSQPRIKWKLR